MARIIVGSYAVQFPLGGYLSWVLQWLVGFKQLGHDVYFVERSEYDHSCFDPVRRVMSDDCTHGTSTLNALLTRMGLGDRWCFVDRAGHYHGMSRFEIDEAFRTCDVFVDMGSHGTWMQEASRAGLRILVDGEPGTTQFRMVAAEAAGQSLPQYDHYLTVGLNIGRDDCRVPLAGRAWRPVVDPVVPELFPETPGDPSRPFTTVMSWQAFTPVTFDGYVYGHKDLEFPKFLNLPARSGVPLAVAIAGQDVPRAQLLGAGWAIADAHEATLSFEAFQRYIVESAGEFAVCKHVFVATRSGWFSDRSAAYLASGRPVVMQDTGFSKDLPCGLGLFAVDTIDEAAAALQEIRGAYARHSRAARDLAHECLATRVVLTKLLADLGCG